MKILAENLSSYQHSYLLRAVPHVVDLYPTEHYLRRAEAKNITWIEAQDAIRRGELIEYHVTEEMERRVLLRAASGVCVVVALGSMELVTCYRNEADDQHENLNISRYWQGPVLDSMLGIGRTWLDA